MSSNKFHDQMTPRQARPGLSMDQSSPIISDPEGFRRIAPDALRQMVGMGMGLVLFIMEFVGGGIILLVQPNS